MRKSHSKAAGKKSRRGLARVGFHFAQDAFLQLNRLFVLCLQHRRLVDHQSLPLVAELSLVTAGCVSKLNGTIEKARPVLFILRESSCGVVESSWVGLANVRSSRDYDSPLPKSVRGSVAREKSAGCVRP